MSDRFFVETPISGDRATLVGPEAHHLAHVMRAEVGTEVTLFDGGGAEFSAKVVKVGRSAIELDVIARHEIDRELPISLTLGVALPKGDRQKWLVEKATELGVTCIVPLKTMRGVAQPVENALDRLRRSVIESSKQCGRNRLLELAEPMRLDDYIDWAPANATRWFAHPAGDATTVTGGTADSAVFLAVGPEGGFTDEEVGKAVTSGWHSISLGHRILRVETAALALCSRWI